MIKITVISNQDIINEIKIVGHANYDEYGKDIVCSSVSSIVITTINGILSINEDSIIYEQNNNDFNIKIIKQLDTTKKLINNMLDLLEQLQKQYTKNIKIDYKEV
jgi:uncharacterized protein